jgi:hypothetical protein
VVGRPSCSLACAPERLLRGSQSDRMRHPAAADRCGFATLYLRELPRVLARASMSTSSAAVWGVAKAISACASESGWRVTGSRTCNSDEQRATAGATGPILRLSCCRSKRRISGQPLFGHDHVAAVQFNRGRPPAHRERRWPPANPAFCGPHPEDPGRQSWLDCIGEHVRPSPCTANAHSTSCNLVSAQLGLRRDFCSSVATQIAVARPA